MGKKRKGKQTTAEQPNAQSDVAKEIDDIFAARKLDSPSIKTKVIKSADVESPSRKPKPNPEASDLASVQRQVQAAKSKGNTVASQSELNEDFADIRGTKKSTI